MPELPAAPLRRIAATFGTPAYGVSIAALEAATVELRDAFPDPWLRAFSLKACDVAAVVARLGALGLGANVVSRAEWTVARRAGISNNRITLEGIGKTDADLRAAVRAAARGQPLRWISVESQVELEVLVALAGRAGLGRGGGGALDVLLRLNPDVAPETHAGLAVGRGGSKFGMTETELTTAVARLRHPDEPVSVRGIHVHVGSQLGAIDAWRDAVRRSLALMALLGATRASFDTLDVGGGFPVGDPGSVPTPGRFARELPELLGGLPPDRRPARLAVEPGRFLVANAGWLVASVLHVRERGDAGRVVVLDAGMTELIRPALYGAHHPVVALTSLGRPIDEPAGRPVAGPAGRLVAGQAGRPVAGQAGRPGGDPPDPAAPSPERQGPARVDGPVCEATDTLGHHDLPPVRRGDLVAIGEAGAYAASMAMTYNGRPRPPQVLIEVDGRLTLGRRRGRLVAR
jgi:diaminopimelate decarboxylase